MLCGAIPLLLGTSVYFAWRLTQWDWLIDAGLIIIYAGTAAVFVGLICLFMHLRRESLKYHSLPSSGKLQGALVAGLLIVNFPAGALFTFSAISIYSRYTVEVVNQSGKPIDSFLISGGGVYEELGVIPAGKMAKWHFYVQTAGSLIFSARQQSMEFGGQIEGYVSEHMRGHKTISIKPEGAFEISTDP